VFSHSPRGHGGAGICYAFCGKFVCVMTDKRVLKALSIRINQLDKNGVHQRVFLCKKEMPIFFTKINVFLIVCELKVFATKHSVRQ
jgi:hypothetical protein